MRRSTCSCRGDLLRQPVAAAVVRQPGTILADLPHPEARRCDGLAAALFPECRDRGAAHYPAHFVRDTGVPAILTGLPEARYGRRPRLAAAVRVQAISSDARQLDTGGDLGSRQLYPPGSVGRAQHTRSPSGIAIGAGGAERRRPYAPLFLPDLPENWLLRLMPWLRPPLVNATHPPSSRMYAPWGKPQPSRIATRDCSAIPRGYPGGLGFFSTERTYERMMGSLAFTRGGDSRYLADAKEVWAGRGGYRGREIIDASRIAGGSRSGRRIAGRYRDMGPEACA